MYRCLATEDGGVEAIICFSADMCQRFIDLFIEDLAMRLANRFKLITIEHYRGTPTPADREILLCDREDESAIRDAVGKRHPGVLAWLLGTNKWSEYQKARLLLNQQPKVFLVTSHDHPCIELSSKIGSPTNIGEEIQHVASALQIEMHETPNIPLLEHLVFANRCWG